MNNHYFQSGSPYNLPHKVQQAAYLLADYMKIPKAYVAHADNDLIEILCGTVLYRRLTEHDRYTVYSQIKQMEYYNRQLALLLEDKILDASVNTSWQPWSLSDEELKEMIKYDKNSEGVIDFFGGGIDFSSAKDIIKFVKKPTNASAKPIVLTALLMALHHMISGEQKSFQQELARRKSQQPATTKGFGPGKRVDSELTQRLV